MADNLLLVAVDISKKDMKFSEKINDKLAFIEDQTGLKLDLCNYFAGVQFFNKRPYFNIVLKDNLCESSHYAKLEKCPHVEVLSNGLKRVAVFI